MGRAADRSRVSGVTELSELTGAIASVTGTLVRCGVPYFITGSLASSMHAEFRATNDIDIVADFGQVDLPALYAAFAPQFYADLEQAIDAIRDRTSFNLIHRASLLKVDFFPLTSDFNRAALARAERVTLGALPDSISIASCEDILLAKLQWYRLGDESSEVQRRDIRGLIALNRERLDTAYLERWAEELGVQDLLQRFRTRS